MEVVVKHVGGPSRLDGPVVLVDGTCNICQRAVRSLIDRDLDGQLRFAPLQGLTAERLRAEAPEIPEGLSTMVVAEPDRRGDIRVLTRSDAAIRAWELTGTQPRLARLVRCVPRSVRDLFYNLVARNRHRLSRRNDRCRLPTESERERFLP